jgi:hypothetical protein
VGQAGVVGKVTGEIFGYTPNGTKIHWRKIGSTIQYFNTTTSLWVTTISGLTASADYTFSNYESLAGAFTFATGIDGIFKMNNANPGFYIALYNASKNFYGYSLIDKGRMLLWGKPTAKTVLFGSHIDPQNGTVYKTVTGEQSEVGDGTTKAFSGNLAFKSQDAAANCFNIAITCPTGASKTITAIPNTLNPQITATSHGLSKGDTIIISNTGTQAGTGTISVGAQGDRLAGSSTVFTTQLAVPAYNINGIAPGTVIYASVGGSSPGTYYVGVVKTINSNTDLILTAWMSTYVLANMSGATFTFTSMSQIGGISLTVASIVDTNNFIVAIDTTLFGLYTSGGTFIKCELLTDDRNGNLTAPSGATGTINYITGAYSYTLINPVVSGVAILKTYQWEDSNNGGVTDFTYSATRVASEGFQVPQDEGGDPILNVLIGTNGYYSMKSNSSYLLIISADDLSINNNIYRKQLGLSSMYSCLSTDAGILFMNTANPGKPELTLLVKNTTDGTLEPKVICSQFRFANYNYNDATFFSYDRYTLIACASVLANNNEMLLLVNVSANTVNITNYACRTFGTDGIRLYMGSSVVQSVYNLFSGLDDDGFAISNQWTTKGENFAVKLRGTKWLAFPWSLKKYRRLRFRGHIAPGQSIQVWANYDDSGWQLVGTILSDASYTDQSNPATMGSAELGINTLGGDIVVNANPFQMEMRMKKMPKFRKRKLQFVATGFGYVDITYEADWDITLYNDMKLPSRFREKQNVALAGTPNDQPLPEF